MVSRRKAQKIRLNQERLLKKQEKDKDLKERSRVDYHIQTTAGSVIYRGEDIVTVQTAPHSYLEKRVEDLNTGERVIFDATHTKTTLEDVAPYLGRSPLYDRATDYVFNSNDYKKPVTKFRETLLKSLAQRGFLEGQDLERVIGGEIGRISPDEYTTFAKYLSETMNGSERSNPKDAKIPKIDAIKSWLKGETLAPKDRKIFSLLEARLGDEFNQFTSEPDDQNGFYRNYRIYVSMRQNIMRLLNNWKGTTQKSDQSENGNGSIIDISTELSLIKSQFFNDVDENLKSVMVTKIEKPSYEQREKIKLKDNALGKGIIRGEIEKIKDERIDLKSLWQDYFILNSYCQRVFQNLEEDSMNPFYRRIMVSESALNRLLIRNYEVSDPLMIATEEKDSRMINNRSDSSFVNGLMDKLIDSVYNNDFDVHYSLSKGSVNLLFDTISSVRNSIPYDIFRYVRDCHYSSTGGRNADRKNIFQKYGCKFDKKGDFIVESSGVMITDHFKSLMQRRTVDIRVNKKHIMDMDVTPQSFFKSNLESYKKMLLGLMQRRTLNNGDLFLVTRSYARDQLKRYGLEGIVDICSEDFLIEDMDIEFPRPIGY
ncbi:hypothetical protein CMI38_05740 [Candidatus Pacearchaeota archaeon]|nr:hypothetical protein [Candidatus Pacearchaeota archaeon]|tara:strand:+ start:410 stop:2200 length:1791 start_codon:yes stop_codon:yes gene_type:complete